MSIAEWPNGFRFRYRWKYVSTHIQSNTALNATNTGTLPLGVTISTPYAVKRVLAEEDCPFRFFSDPTNEVADAYDVAHDLDGMAGISEPRPAFFALESDLTVEAAWVAREWPEFPDYDALESEFGLE